MQQEPSTYSDEDLDTLVRSLQLAIEQWATKHELWYDCGFQSYAERVDGDPGEGEPVATILHFDGDLGRALDGDFDGLDVEFFDLLDKHGFWYERNDGVSAHIYPNEDNPQFDAFSNYVRWQWICGLVQPDIADVHEEIYSHFAARPDDLHRLSWREFEILLFRVLQNQGFEAELGPGQGDGGVDIRLLQRDPLGDILTLVQAKNYALKNKIDLGPVAALHGVASVEGAQRSLFVTTSSYLPSAKKFAARTSGSMTLATSQEVREWCQTATEGIIQDKSQLVAPNTVSRLLGSLVPNDARIVHASTGVTMILNDFALVLKETNHAALLMGIPKITLSDDGHGQQGYEIPDLGPRCLEMLKADNVFRAKRSVSFGRVGYWTGQHLYTPWDGKPEAFSHLD